MITAKVTPAQYDELAEKLHAQSGLSLVGRSGKLSKQGLGATYAYDGETLKIEIVDHPFFIPKSVCEQRLKEALAVNGVVAE